MPENGSSGAPIFDQTNYRLVAIHIGKGKSIDPKSFNQALLISRIIELSEDAKFALVGLQPTITSKGATPSTSEVNLQLPDGRAFVKTDATWRLVEPGRSTLATPPLVEQRGADKNYLLWDPQTDFFYEIPKAGGPVRAQRVGDLGWSSIGSARAANLR